MGCLKHIEVCVKAGSSRNHAQTVCETDFKSCCAWGQHVEGEYLGISAIVSRVIKALTAHISSVSRPSATSVHAPVCLH